MPPKAKYSAESVIEASRKIIAEQGIGALTAREISATLGSTTAPIFTYFGSMEEVVKAVYESVSHECGIYLMEALDCFHTLTEFGVRWIKYAREKPNFYEFIFLHHGMTKDLVSTNQVSFSKMLEPLVEKVSKTYKITVVDAVSLVHTLTLVLSGLCNSIISNFQNYSDQDIVDIVGKIEVSMVNGFHLTYKNEAKKTEETKMPTAEAMKKYFS